MIDVGGDVNRECRERLPLFASVDFVRADNARVLLTEPSLDLTATVEAQTPDVYARGSGELALADMIEEEVRGESEAGGGGGGHTSSNRRSSVTSPGRAFAVTCRWPDEGHRLAAGLVMYEYSYACSRPGESVGLRGCFLAPCWCLWQTAAERARGVEAADAVRLARLVRCAE